MQSHVVVVSIWVLLLVGVLTLPVGAATIEESSHSAPVAATSQSTADEIRMTTTLDRSPDRVGEITATVSFRFPERVTELTARLPDGATVTETNGFSRDTETTYEWDERTDDPSVSFRVDADRLTDDEGPLAEEGQYLFADTEEWALVSVPTIGEVRWARTGDEDDDLAFVRETTVEGPGVAGDRMAFLGEHTVVTRSAHGQTFRLVVPEAADLAEPPAAILDSLSHAADTLRVGDRDAEVLVIAAPTGTVDWGVRGLQTADAELWVQDGERLDTPTNVWVHEYVHTRQRFANRTTAETRWLTEASATYYAALLTLQDNRIEFDEFRRALELGESDTQSGSTLSHPDSWQDHANYGKGSLVVGDLDRRIRLSTDNEASFETVFRSLNRHDGRLSASDVADYVASSSTPEVGAAAREYTTTESTPTVWSTEAHAAAFGQSPARFDIALADENPVRITGPDRSEVVTGTEITLAVGETLSVDVVVENVGGTVGSYELPFRVGDTTTTQTGRLAPSETSTHEFSHTFSDPGEYTVSVGDARFDIRVEAPAASSDTAEADTPIDIETPGFGLFPAVSALLLILLLGRGRR